MTERPTAEQVAWARERLESDEYAPVTDQAEYILAELDAVTAERDAARAAKHQIVDTINKSVAEQWAGLEAQVYDALRERDEAQAAIREAADELWYSSQDEWRARPAVKAAMGVSDAN